MGRFSHNIHFYEKKFIQNYFNAFVRAVVKFKLKSRTQEPHEPRGLYAHTTYIKMRFCQIYDFLSKNDPARRGTMFSTWNDHFRENFVKNCLRNGLKRG